MCVCVCKSGCVLAIFCFCLLFCLVLMLYIVLEDKEKMFDFHPRAYCVILVKGMEMVYGTLSKVVFPFVV